MAYTGWRQGGFFPTESSLVLAVSLCILGVAILMFSSQGLLRPEEIWLLVLAAWWFLVAAVHHSMLTFQPLGATFVATAAASFVGRSLTHRCREVARWAIIILASLSAAIGLLACCLRWRPYALSAQDLWRLASTLTYANAAGLLLAIGLLFALGLEHSKRVQPAVVALLFAGLLATQSRGAVLAGGVAVIATQRGKVREVWLALCIGLLAGFLVIGTSSGPTLRPITLVVVTGVLAGAIWAHGLQESIEKYLRRIESNGRRMRAAGAFLLPVIGALGLLVHSQLIKRIDWGSNLGRLREWRLALVQFHANPWIGVGPDKPMGDSSSMVLYAHNEYLQILAGGGVVAGVLLLLAMGSVFRGSEQKSFEYGAIVIFAVAGLFDYTWHLSTLGLLTGLALGLATCHLPEKTEILSI